MREIKIYSSVVEIDENITKDEMIKGNLANLLDKTIKLSHNERNEIIDSFRKMNININEITCPDGFNEVKNQRDRKLLCEELRKTK